MKNEMIRLVVGLVAVGAFGSAAMAADWGRTGAKDYGAAAVPVPAPAPVPVSNASWYLRADVTVGKSSSPSISESGARYGYSDYSAGYGVGFGSSSSWYSNDYDTFFGGSAGIGYYWTRNIRFDVTGEARTKGTVTGSGSYRYQTYSYQGGPPATWQAVSNTYTRGTATDVAEHQASVFLVNGYYDVGRYAGFTPYVGGGIGFAYNDIARTVNGSYVQCNESTNPTCTSLTATTDNGSVKVHGFTFAAAAMVGATYNISEQTLLDVGYRFLYLQGMHASVPLTNGVSKLTIGDTNEHQVRAGVRFNIN